LKRLVLIFTLLAFKFYGQLDPPSLRCLEVYSNGNVKLTWLPTSDPGGTFNSYEIYSSVAFLGPYTAVGSVGALAFTSYTHATSTASSQSLYYYMRVKSGPGGNTLSGSSDTIKTIFLNPTPSGPQISLPYNNLRLPKLNSSASTFTVNKEFPVGIWNSIGVTPNLNYSDTLSVCSASINYRVALQDNSGCISLSNVRGGVFTDEKAPNEPSIDSISVLPNGNTVLAWQVPYDIDIKKYRIYYNTGSFTPIDSVLGKLSTLYTYTTTTANTKTVGLYVSGMDSCDNIGSFDTKPRTIYLTKYYNTCAYSTALSWNAYVGMKGGISEYRIYYSVNGGAFFPVGSTSTTSFLHEGVSPGQNIKYFVRAFNGDKTITSSSNRVDFFSTQAAAPLFVYISSASVESDNTVKVNIFLDLSVMSQGIDLQRSEDGINFNSISNISLNGGANYSYTDSELDTKARSYYYRAVVKDSCGNPRINSNLAKTVHLKVNDDKQNYFNKNLKWTHYQGFDGGVSGYNIYRIVNDFESGSPIGTTGTNDTTFTDNIEDEVQNGANIVYYVEAVEGISNQHGFLEKAKSNREKVYMEADVFVPNVFAPRGKNKIWLPITHFADKSEYSIRVFDKWGQKKFETQSTDEGWDGKNGKPDVYVYIISYKNSRGEYIEKKGTFVML